MVMFIGDLGNLPPTIAFFLAAVFLCCNGSRWQKLSVGLIIGTEAFGFSTLVDSIWQIDSVVTTILRSVFWLTLWLIMKKENPLQVRELREDTWKLIGLLSVTPLGIVLAVILLQSPMRSTTSGAMVTNAVLLLLAIGSLAILMQIIPALAAKEKLETQNQIYEMNRIYYENLERQQTEIRILRHDMANHLSVLAGLPEGERQSYVEKLTGSFALGRQVRYCNHPVVNGLLNAKMSAMENLSIVFRPEILVPDSLPVRDVDLCALVGNSLDNAMEACQKVEEASRFIDFTMRAEKGLLVLQVVNGAPGDLNLHYSGSRGKEASAGQRTLSHLPGTTKRASQGHGFGLRSMQEVTERYGGNLELSAGEGRFTLFLYLPLEEKGLGTRKDGRKSHDYFA